VKPFYPSNRSTCQTRNLYRYSPGGKKREDIYQAFENIYPVLTEFRKLANPAEEDQLAQLAAGVGPAPALPAP
jgi:hypothetical protein